jgi:AraC-like DNA-binding protein
LGVLEQRVIPGALGAEQYYRRLLAELDREPAAPGLAALRTMMVQALLVEFLVFVARCYATHRLGQGGEGFPALRAGGPFEELKRWLSAPERLANPPTLAEMAARTSLSPSHFAVLFKRETAQTPLEFLTAARVEAAARRLRAEPEVKITTLAHELGFSSSQYFSLVFKKINGCTPGEWREQR